MTTKSTMALAELAEKGADRAQASQDARLVHHASDTIGSSDAVGPVSIAQ
jgi:hypothetical protein